MTTTKKIEKTNNTSIFSKIKEFLITPKFTIRNVLLSLILGFGLAYVVLLSIYGVSGANHIVGSLFWQDFLDSNTISLLIRKMVVLGFAGMAVGFGMKAGILNIGVSGQMTAGGFMGYFLISKSSWMQNLDNNNMVLFIMVFVVVGTAILTALLSGLLKAYFKVNEVISTIMINWIVVYIVKRFATGQKKTDMTVTALLNGNVTNMADRFTFGSEWLYAGVSIGLLIVAGLITWFMLSKTKFGFKTIAVGINENAAEYAGYNSKILTLKAFIISGLFAGIAGYIMFFLSYNSIPASEAPINEGFMGIAVALVAMLNPLAIIPSAIIFGILDGPIGGIIVSGYTPTVVTIFSGVITYFVAITTLFLYFRPILFIKEKMSNHKEKKLKRIEEKIKDSEEKLKIAEQEVK